MGHGTTEIDPPIRDHTRDALRAAAEASAALANHAADVLRDAKKNVILAEWAAAESKRRAAAAWAELNAYNPR